MQKRLVVMSVVVHPRCASCHTSIDLEQLVRHLQGHVHGEQAFDAVARRADMGQQLAHLLCLDDVRLDHAERAVGLLHLRLQASVQSLLFVKWWNVIQSDQVAMLD